MLKILHQKIQQLLKNYNSIDSSVIVKYTGSVLTPATTKNYTIPYTQTEVITFSINIVRLCVSEPYELYNTVEKVRAQLLGKRVIDFDPQVSGIEEVASQFLDEAEPGTGKYGQTLIIQVKRPRVVNQRIC